MPGVDSVYFYSVHTNKYRIKMHNNNILSRYTSKVRLWYSSNVSDTGMLLFYVQNVWFPDWAGAVLFAAITTSLHETAAIALTIGYSGIYKLFHIRGLPPLTSPVSQGQRIHATLKWNHGASMLQRGLHPGGNLPW